MREIRTSGSVRGEGGDVLTYSARDFIDGAIAIEVMRSCVGIGLQCTLELLQMLPRMFPLAVL